MYGFDGRTLALVTCRPKSPGIKICAATNYKSGKKPNNKLLEAHSYFGNREKKNTFKQIDSLTCPQVCLKIFSKCHSALQKLSAALICNQMLGTEGYIFLPSLTFFWGLCNQLLQYSQFSLIYLLRPLFFFFFFSLSCTASLQSGTARIAVLI